MPVGKVYRTAIQYTVAGVGAVNVLNFRGPDVPNGATALCAAVASEWCQQMKERLAVTTVFTKITAVQHARFGVQDAAELAVNIPGNPGLALGDAPQSPIVFNHNTGRFGKSARGRWYQGGIPDLWVENGKLTVDAITQLTATIAALKVRWTGPNPTSGYNLGIFSPKYWSILSNPLEDWFHDTVSISLNPIVGTLKSRRPSV